ncbi:uncharacterized protein LOC123293506 [Chrysoperla carnea]|uniref:uncharacterized protein LOC123293506 n=1 Tax=Chrysoperla carnea TaxID=189513 RepID=UPI001D07974C|nr:uncharacterized protein LOC123293506 [Chrysoperla carnea]
MAKIPRDTNLFNNIVKCLRKVTRVDLDKYGRADPIQRFVNKTTDEMTQDICYLMDEVTSNLDSMYSEIKHIFNYYNSEMEKIASKFHETNMCQNDAGKLQAELVKSVTDLNIKAESFKSDLQAQQSEFQKYIHDYMLTLQEKSERNYQILNKLKMKQHTVTDRDNDSESIKDMIENYSKSGPLQFSSASMSSNGMFSSINSHIPSTSKQAEYQNQSKLDLENTSKNLEEICKKLKMTSKNLEYKSEQNSELTSETNSHPKDLKNKLQSSNNNLNNEKFNNSDKSEMKSQTNNAKKSGDGLKSFKVSDKVMPSHKNDIPILEEEEGEREVPDNDWKETRKRKSDNVSKSFKTKSNEESKLLKKKESLKAFKLPQKSKSEKTESDFKTSTNNSKLEVSRAKAMENIPNQMEKKLNDLNVLLSQTQSLNEEDDKDGLISRTSSLPDEPSDTNKLFDIKKQSLHNDSRNKKFDRFEFQNKLATKTAHFSTSDTCLKTKIPWYLQSTTNFQSSTNENVPPTCDGPPPMPLPPSPPSCCVSTPPPPPICPCAPDPCNDPCNPCEKDESHGSIKYDLFEAYLCSKPKATRYMDYLESVRKGLKDQSPNAGVCNQFIMSHTEFLEAIDTRNQLLKSIEKHRESQVPCLEPSALAKLKAIVTCKLGRLKTCSAVAKPVTHEQQPVLTDQPKYPHELGLPSPQSEQGHQFYLERQQNIKSLPAGKLPAVPHTFTPTPTETSFPHSSQVNAQYHAAMPEHNIHSTGQPAVESAPSAIQNQYAYLENQPAASYEQKTASQSQLKHDQLIYSENHPVVTQEPHSPPVTDVLKGKQAQPRVKQEQYSYSDPQPSVRQDMYIYSEAPSANQHQHQEAKSPVKQEFQQSTGNEQHSSQEGSAVRQEPHTHSKDAAGQGYNYAGVQSAKRQEQYSYSQSPPETNQEHHSSLNSQHSVKQDQYAHSETQHTVSQQPHNYSHTQHEATQEHQHKSTTCSKNAQHVAKEQFKPSQTLSETPFTTIREPYNHLEIQSEEKFVPTPVAQQPEETNVYPAPSSNTSHSQTPPTPEKFIYPEMRPFEPKPSPMRQHIEQKIAEAAKPIIETPDSIKPVKPIYLHENIPVQKSETSPAESNTTASSSETSSNSTQEYKSKTTSIPQMSQSYDRSKYPESPLGPTRRSFTKFDVNKDSFKVTPTKR